MKFLITLFVICGSLPIHAMDDKKTGGGVSGCSTKEQLAKLTAFDCPPKYNPSAWLYFIETGKRSSEKNKEFFSDESRRKKPHSGHMNF